MVQLRPVGQMGISGDQLLASDDHSGELCQPAGDQQLEPVARVQSLQVASTRLHRNRDGWRELWQGLLLLFQRPRRMFW